MQYLENILWFSIKSFHTVKNLVSCCFFSCSNCNHKELENFHSIWYTGCTINVPNYKQVKLMIFFLSRITWSHVVPRGTVWSSAEATAKPPVAAVVNGGQELRPNRKLHESKPLMNLIMYHLGILYWSWDWKPTRLHQCWQSRWRCTRRNTTNHPPPRVPKDK